MSRVIFDCFVAWSGLKEEKNKIYNIIKINLDFKYSILLKVKKKKK